MALPAPTDGGSLTVHQVLCRWAPAYLARFGAATPARQRAVLQTLLACRTPTLGGALHYCPDCGHRYFSYHSSTRLQLIDMFADPSEKSNV